MTPFLGCERARVLLDGYLDGELSIPDQVAVEAHLRVCDTCAARIEDAQLIATSLRTGSALRPTAEDTRALAGMSAGTLARIRAERDQALPARLREAFADMRLLWPALGAIGSVLLGMALALGMLHRAGTERPESLAAMLHAMADRHAPDADRLRAAVSVRMGPPLWFDTVDTMMAPKLMEFDPAAFEGLLDDGGVVTVSAMLDGGGRIDGYELLFPDDPGASLAVQASALAVQETMRSMRFAPAIAADGSGLPVGAILAMARTTVTPGPAPRVMAPVVTPAVIVPAEGGDLPGVDEPVPPHEIESGLSSGPHMPWT